MAKVAPSVLAADFGKLAEEVRMVDAAGADILHLDVMDGHFVPNISFGMCVAKDLRKHTKMKMEAHLMISEPEKYVKGFADAGCDIINYHLEAAKNPRELNKQIKDFGMEVGIAVDAGTPIEKVFPYLSELQYVVVMSVKAGFSGQKFMPQALEKIKKLVQERGKKSYKFQIMIDGGINNETGKLARGAGAEILVAASYIFKNRDPKQAIESLKQL